MSLSDEIANQNVRARTTQIDRAIAQLKGSDLSDFIDALNDESVPPSAISRALLKRGIVVDARRISEYRNNGGLIRYGSDGKRVVG